MKCSAVYAVNFDMCAGYENKDSAPLVCHDFQKMFNKHDNSVNASDPPYTPLWTPPPVGFPPYFRHHLAPAQRAAGGMFTT